MAVLNVTIFSSMKKITHRDTSPRENFFTIRLSDSDRATQRDAAAVAGVTEADFVRTAVKEKIVRLVGARLAEAALAGAGVS
jgi:hypothetical protein